MGKHKNEFQTDALLSCRVTDDFSHSASRIKKHG
jgi:hypothetical protein